VGGQLVPVATLAELFAGRVEISSQHSSQALLKPEAHGLLLDAGGGLQSERAEVERCFAAARSLGEELSALRERAEERVRRQDFLTFQLSEIDAAGLEPGEVERLETERTRLVHAVQLREAGGAALAGLVGDLDALDDRNACDLLAQALRSVEALAKLDASLADLAERLRADEAELRDAASDLAHYVDGVESDPAKLAQLEDRLQQLQRLQSKYGRNLEEILAFRARTAEELAGIEGADAREAELVSAREAEVARLTEAAARLSRGRLEAAGKLQRRIQRALRSLAIPEARFEIRLEPLRPPEDLPCGPAGAEAPRFYFSANKGESPRPLEKVASGGELSRVLLALKNALRSAPSGMVLVFDEVDAGIGGGVAERVGRALAELAGRHQVICITHLPQIAAFAQTHFRVEKTTRAGRTLARIARVEGDARVAEIARMAAGETVSKATLRHAEDLLRASSPQR
jgi:DNA repair protein RecN (Recombination protein N)